MTPAPSLVPGRRYLVIYQHAGQRYPRYLVADYLGESKFDQYQFNGEPVGGVQSLQKYWVKLVRPVIPVAPTEIGGDARKLPDRLGGPRLLDEVQS